MKLAKAAGFLLAMGCLLLPAGIAAQNDAYEKYEAAAIHAKAQGRYDEAEKNYLLALKEVEGPAGSDTRTQNALTNLGQFYDGQRRYDEAEKNFVRALEAAKAFTRKSRDPQYEPIKMTMVTVSTERLAEFYATRKRYAEAEIYYQQAFAQWETEAKEKTMPRSNNAYLMAMLGALAVGSRPEKAAQVCDRLADIYIAQGRLADAEAQYRRALAIREKDAPKPNQKLAASFGRLALLCTKEQKYADAEPLYRRMLAITREEFGEEHPRVAAALQQIAVFYAVQGKYAEAEANFQAALEIFEKTRGKESTEVALTLENFARLMRRMGRVADAEKYDARARAIRDGNTVAPPP
jgi:tetratricopeptide (TPR) repeat protein